MLMKAWKTIVHCSLHLCVAATGVKAFAQVPAPSAWPTKPVRIVVGFPAGGPADVVARQFADHATRVLGQPFIVENKPGVNSSLAAEAVARSTADGYTVLVATSSHATSAALHDARLKFDAVRSFAPVCSVGTTATVLTVGRAMPVKTLSEFLQQVKKEPGQRTYGTPGSGSAVHFASEQFMRIAGTSMLHVPYKGAAPVVNDLVGGQVDSSFATMGSVMLHVQSGKLTALAVAARKRSALLPNVPTFEEAGVKGYTNESWYGLLVPAGVPASVVAALQRVALDFTQSASTASKLKPLGIEPSLTCGDEFRAVLERDLRTFRQIVRDLDLKAE